MEKMLRIKFLALLCCLVLLVFSTSQISVAGARVKKDPIDKHTTTTTDTTKPIINLVGSAKVSLNIGDSYTDAGATAYDNVDGDITSKIVVNNPVNTNIASTYTVTYNVTDNAGNQALQVTRMVTVAAATTTTNNDTTPATPVPDTTTNDATTTTPVSDTINNNTITTTNVYYVSTEGSDSSPGTISRPWKTIQKAANTVKQGDTVYIRGGTYNERVVLNSSGSENNYITFANYPSEAVTIDGAGIDWGYDWNCLFNLNKQFYIKVIGLRIINSRWAGIGSEPDENGCQHVIIQNCSTYNTKSSGIAFFRGADITIDGNSVEKACTGTYNTQECISLAVIANFVIKNNHVFNCNNVVEGAGGEGIDAKDGCTNGSIYNNTVNNIAKIGIYIDAYSKDQYNIEVYDNKVYNCGQGITVATEHDGLLENVNMHNNLVYSCSWGLTLANWGSGSTHAMKDIFFINNTTYDCEEFNMWLGNTEAKHVVIINNIFGGGTYPGCIPIFRYEVNLSEVTIEHNFLNRVGSGQPTGTNYIVGDPKFINPGNFDFSLAEDSLAINSGLTLDGKVCNMGAF